MPPPSPPAAAPPRVGVPFSDFRRVCELRPNRPFWRFWGAGPGSPVHGPAWRRDDPNLAILPTSPPRGGKWTMPFLDTHVAVRFLGGVSTYAFATAHNCQDEVSPQSLSSWRLLAERTTGWCDLVVRAPNGTLHTRFDLVRSRLDPWLEGEHPFDLMLVLDNVPWAFVANESARQQPCKYGCQYLPPDDAEEFAQWVGTLATFVRDTYGAATAARVEWRLGTEPNAGRWAGRSDNVDSLPINSRTFERYWDTYAGCTRTIRAAIPEARIGAGNWEEQGKHAHGDLSPDGTDSFQYEFYRRVAAHPDVPLSWTSISHYGFGEQNLGGFGPNFPQADEVQRVGSDSELRAMARLAQRPNASLDIMEWGILANERGQRTAEPSPLGAAWAVRRAPP